MEENDGYDGARVMVMALRLCQEYMLEHKFDTLCRVDCQCRICKKVRDLYKRIGGDDGLHVLKAKYFQGGEHD